MTLDQFIQQMRPLGKTVVEMVRKADQPEMAENLIEDVVIKTLTLVRDNPGWSDEAWKREARYSPPVARTKPPVPKHMTVKAKNHKVADPVRSAKPRRSDVVEMETTPSPAPQANTTQTSDHSQLSMTV